MYIHLMMCLHWGPVDSVSIEATSSSHIRRLTCLLQDNRMKVMLEDSGPFSQAVSTLRTRCSFLALGKSASGSGQVWFCAWTGGPASWGSPIILTSSFRFGKRHIKNVLKGCSVQEKPPQPPRRQGRWALPLGEGWDAGWDSSERVLPLAWDVGHQIARRH